MEVSCAGFGDCLGYWPGAGLCSVLAADSTAAVIDDKAPAQQHQRNLTQYITDSRSVRRDIKLNHLGVQFEQDGSS